MYTITNHDVVRELENRGIDVLTGERCSLGMRVLCDYTHSGAEILRRCLDITIPEDGSNWNSGSKDDPHVGSIMLLREMLEPLAIFAMATAHGVYAVMIEKYPKEAGLRGYAIHAFASQEELRERVEWYNKAFQEVRDYRIIMGAGSAVNNRHEFTGRL